MTEEAVLFFLISGRVVTGRVGVERSWNDTVLRRVYIIEVCEAKTLGKLRGEMTQKATQFKGQQKRKTIPPNRHGKSVQTRKGKRNVKPAKFTKDMDTDRVPFSSSFSSFCSVLFSAKP